MRSDPITSLTQSPQDGRLVRRQVRHHRGGRRADTRPHASDSQNDRNNGQCSRKRATAVLLDSGTIDGGNGWIVGVDSQVVEQIPKAFLCSLADAKTGKLATLSSFLSGRPRIILEFCHGSPHPGPLSRKRARESLLGAAQFDNRPLAPAQRSRSPGPEREANKRFPARISAFKGRLFQASR